MNRSMERYISMIAVRKTSIKNDVNAMNSLNICGYTAFNNKFWSWMLKLNHYLHIDCINNILWNCKFYFAQAWRNTFDM